MGKPYLQDVGHIILGCETYILHNGRILMHKRADTKRAFPGFWIAPGGHVDEGEDALSAAIREVKEEAGVTLTPENIQLKAIGFHHHRDRKELYILHIFLATIGEFQPTVSDPREGESRWLTMDELSRLDTVFPASKYYFDHILGNKPGILYTNLLMENGEIVEELARQVDANS